MAVAIVIIAGRSYRLGCDEGQEKRLEELAASVDGKIAAMRSNVGEIGDQRLIVMAAIEARLAKSFDAAATRLERLAQQLAGDIGESDSPL